MRGALLAVSLVVAAAAFGSPVVTAPDSVRVRLAAAARPFDLPQARRQPRAAVLAPDDSRLSGLVGFSVEVDAVTGVVARAIGGAVPWPCPEAPGGEARRACYRELAHRFMLAHPGIFPVPLAALVYDAARSVSVAEHGLDVVRFTPEAEGRPVLGGSVVFVIRWGSLVYFGSSWAQVPSEASLDALDAAAVSSRLLSHASILASEVAFVAPRRERFWLPEATAAGVRHRAIRVVRFHPLADDREWEGWIDERSGEVVALAEAGASACPLPPPSSAPPVTGGVRPARADQAEETRRLPYVDVGVGKFARASGLYDWVGGAHASELRGRFATINCLSCQDPLQARAEALADGTIPFGVNDPLDPDSRGNGTSTVASRTAYLHTNTARDLAAKWLGGSLSFLDAAIEVQVNGLNSCNALWSGFALKLSRSSSECRNSGEIRDIVAHEWGHALDDFDGTGISDRGYSEGVADVLAMSLDRDSCIAESIFVDPLAPRPSDRCSGIRDLDEASPGLTHSPRVLSIGNNDCNGGYHCLGEIYGQAVWHLVFNLSTGRSYGSGSPLGRALGANVAWETAERLFLLSRPLAEVMDPAAAGISVYDAYILADRSPLGNYPHAAAINEAFSHHGLTENPPQATGFDCPAPAAPSAITTSGEIDAAGGSAVNIGWTDTAATRYQVLYRRIGAELAFSPVATVSDDDRPKYYQLHAEREVGATYEYLVLAESEPGCWSADSAREIMTVALPDIHIDAHAESDPLPGGDGDGIIEPGEFATITIDLAEMGGLSDATAVAATLTSLDPLVRVAALPPVSYGTIAASGVAPGSSPFVVQIDPSHDCRGTVPFLLSIDSQEGCRVRGLTVVLPPAACPLSDRSEVRFVRARVLDDGANPDCSDHDLEIDSGEHAVIAITVENVGSAAASSVDVLLSTPQSEVVFVGGSRATLATALPPSGRADVEVAIVAGDLPCQTIIPFGVEVRAPENLGPDVQSFTLAGERDMATGTLTWDFESGAEGWSGDGLWSLSSARSNPSDSGTSFWSGAGFNQCSHLRSPPFTLHPSGGSMLTLSTWYALEGRFQAKWWDGANVYLIRPSGEVRLTPVGGRGYDGNLTSIVLCEAGAAAWSSNLTGQSWAESHFDLSPYAGETVVLDVRYATDNKTTGEGFYLDDAIVTGVATEACDGTTCAVDPTCATPEMRLTIDPGCVGSPTVLTPEFDFFGQGVFEYEWDFGDGDTLVPVVPDALQQHVYRSPGSYAARLSARSIADPLCSSSASATVVIGSRPPIDAGGDAPSPLRLGRPGFAGYDYAWSPALGLDSPGIPQPTATPVLTTEYCLEVTDLASGCRAGDCVVVYVPTTCGAAAGDIDDFLLARQGDDVVGSWSGLAAAVAYAAYKLNDAERISAVEAWNTKATLVSSGTALFTVDPGAVPASPTLIFYQIVPQCP